MIFIVFMAIIGGFGSLFVTVPAWGWIGGLAFMPFAGSATAIATAIITLIFSRD